MVTTADRESSARPASACRQSINQLSSATRAPHLHRNSRRQPVDRGARGAPADSGGPANSAGPAGSGGPPSAGEIVTKAFSQRRKTLRNNLKGLLDADAIEACGIDPSIRTESLSLDDLVRLHTASC